MALVIVDYGMGNLRSVQKAFRRLGHDAEISSSPEIIAKATRLVLPGVGHFARGMANLRERGLVEPMTERVIGAGVPMLGICLGMQLMTRGSEEGEGAGLGWFEASTVRLRPPSASLKVPHFGWNTVASTRADPMLVDGTSFYFAHSYALTDCEPAAVLGVTHYGVDFPSVVRKGNLVAAQFHPEKSHGRGLRLLERFLEIA